MSIRAPDPSRRARCLRCGLELGTTRRGLSIDRPLLECTRCRGIVLRPGATEWDLLRTEQKAAIAARHALVALAVGPVVTLVPLALDLAAGRTWGRVAALAWLAAGWLLTGAWRAARLAATIRRSRRRMRDPMYLAKLVEHQIAQATRS